jgi:ACS family hexuronate transporter-like MFS transporter
LKANTDIQRQQNTGTGNNTGKGAFKLKGLRWYIVSLIGLATIINYIDRGAINFMWPYIYKDFGIADADSKNALALITTFFMIAYAIGQTVTGKMMDAIGTRLGMVVSIIGWSISIALHALAKSILSFNLFRFLLGISEAGNWPGATKSNAEWFPPKERAIAQGIFGAGASLGSVVAAPVIAGLFLAFGWKTTFVVIAVLGFLWIIPWLLINKHTPDKHPWITKEEQDHIQQGQQTGEAVHAYANTVYTWRQLLQFKNTWGIISSRFFIDPVWWLFVTWLPTFLKEQYQFDMKQIGAFAWVPYLFAAIGGLAGGFFSSSQIRKGIPAPKARKQAITIGSIIMLSSLTVIAFYLDHLKEQANIAIALISATLFGFQFLINNIQTLPGDYFHGKNVGTVAGMGGTSAVIGTLITIWLVPVITKTSYTSFFILGALMVPLAWICITFITAKPNQTIQNKSTAI